MTIPKSPPCIGRRSVLALTGGLLAAPAIVRAQGPNGVALVIGNSKYRWEAPLPNTKRDVTDIARRFEQLGIKTELVQEVGREGMIHAIEKFKSAARGANFAVFYFAGHGALFNRYSCIVPLDVDLSSPNTAKDLVALPVLIEAANGAANRLIILDNCRNNPSSGWRQRHAESLAVSRESENTVAAMATVPPNSLILFSTPAGRIALDGPPGQNSPFATTLLRQLESPSVDLRSLPEKLRRDLLLATEGHQLLWSANSYQSPFVLTGPANRRPTSPGPASVNVIELGNAYAFAAQSKLPLPSGLIAYRSPPNAKAGSFRFDLNGLPALLVVTAAEGATADIILTHRLLNRAQWKAALADVSGDKSEFAAWDEGPLISFVWRDGNSGTVTLLPTGSQAGNRIATASFQRLDG